MNCRRLSSRFCSDSVRPCQVRFWPSGFFSCHTAELTGFGEALRWTESFIHHGECVRNSYDSKHAARVALCVHHARKNIALANRCNDLFLRSKGKFHVTVHHVFGHAGTARNECAVCAVSLDLKRPRFTRQPSVLLTRPTSSDASVGCAPLSFPCCCCFTQSRH